MILCLVSCVGGFWGPDASLFFWRANVESKHQFSKKCPLQLKSAPTLTNHTPVATNCAPCEEDVYIFCSSGWRAEDHNVLQHMLFANSINIPRLSFFAFKKFSYTTGAQGCLCLPGLPPSPISDMFTNRLSNAAMLLVLLGVIEALLVLCLRLTASLRYSVLLALETAHALILASIPLSVLPETRCRVSPPTLSLTDIQVGNYSLCFELFSSSRNHLICWKS